MPDLNVLRMYPEALIAYQGHSLLITDPHGRVRGGVEGLYVHQTRFLSVLRLTLDDREPEYVSANPVDPYAFLAYFVAPHPQPGAAEPGSQPDPAQRAIAERAIEVQVDAFVGDGLHLDVTLTDHAPWPARVRVGWDLRADFADLTEAMGTRTFCPPVHRRWDPEEGELSLHCDDPRLRHRLQVRFPRLGDGPRVEGDRIVYDLDLSPGEPARFCLDLVPVFLGCVLQPAYDCGSFRSHDTPGDRARDQLLAEAARLSTPVAHVQQAWDRAAGDLASLALLDGQGPAVHVPAAGIPNYQALFGRDTLTAAWQGNLLGARMLRGVLGTVAAWLGRACDDRHDEQPGRVLHQHQWSPRSVLGIDPYLAYYGDYAGPGMFLTAAGWYFNQTGDREFLKELRPALDACLAWIDRDADLDGDGFYEYDTCAGEKGTKNQGWKDSAEAILYPDGSCVPNPIAAVEVQGYVFVAKQVLGQTLLALGDVATGTRLLREAAHLKARFNRAFWWPEAGCFYLGLDREHRPIRTVASNMGHCLAAGVVDQDRAAATVARLMAPDMFSGWGIRTLSSAHPAYHPFSYHLGSVWPPENASIALGFKRYGQHQALHDLARGLFDATLLFEHRRLPEAIGGHARDAAHPHPGIYPRSCAPQAWSASAVVMLVQALLGVRVYAPLNVVLVDPELPSWLPELTLEDLAVGRSRVSLQFKRDGSGHTDVRVLRSEGHPHVVRQAPSNDLSVGWFDRIGDLVGSLRSL